jgi:ribosomal protein L7Ae-like RNA K-turn-binding protein
MSIKEIGESMRQGKVVFGIRQAVKLSKRKKKPKVFVVGDVREETVKILQQAKINFDSLGKKEKKDIAKELGLDFESEVFSII